MSWFNTDLICMDCADKEKSHPKYQEAKDRENEEVRKGNLNYEGIGFDAEYQDYVYVGNDEKCKLNGFYWSMMNNRDMNNWIIPEQEPTYFYNQFGQKVSNTGYHLEATRGIDTFTEPFEDDEKSSNWLLAAGIAGVFALGAWLLPKGD